MKKCNRLQITITPCLRCVVNKTCSQMGKSRYTPEIDYTGNTLQYHTQGLKNLEPPH